MRAISVIVAAIFLATSAIALPPSRQPSDPKFLETIDKKEPVSQHSLFRRQNSITYTTDPTTLLIGYCAAIGTCEYGHDTGCYTKGCLQPNLGGICSCVEDIQAIVVKMTAVGRSYWPVVAA